MARDHDAEALAASDESDRLTGLLAAPTPTTVVVEGFQPHSLVRLGDPERVGQAVTELDHHLYAEARRTPQDRCRRPRPCPRELREETGMPLFGR